MKHELNELEVQILFLTSRGYTCKAISELLNVPFASVETYKVRVCRFLGARNSSHAVFLGLRYGIISFDKKYRLLGDVDTTLPEA